VAEGLWGVGFHSYHQTTTQQGLSMRDVSLCMQQLYFPGRFPSHLRGTGLVVVEVEVNDVSHLPATPVDNPVMTVKGVRAAQCFPDPCQRTVTDIIGERFHAQHSNRMIGKMSTAQHITAQHSNRMIGKMSMRKQILHEHKSAHT